MFILTATDFSGQMVIYTGVFSSKEKAMVEAKIIANDYGLHEFLPDDIDLDDPVVFENEDQTVQICIFEQASVDTNRYSSYE